MTDADRPSRRGTAPEDTPASTETVLGSGLSVVSVVFSFLFYGGFLSAAVFFGYQALELYREQGFGAGPAALAGGALVCLGVVGTLTLRGWRKRKEAGHSYEESPGAYRSEWGSSRIQANGFPGSVDLPGWLGDKTIESWRHTVLGFVVLWGAIGLSFFLLPHPMRLIFPAPMLFGAGYLTFLLYRAVRHRLAYDRATLSMDPFPAAVGGTLEGSVETGIPARSPPPAGFLARLVCYRRTPGSKGDDTRYQELWSAEEVIPGPEDGAAPPKFTVSFDLPDGQPPSTLERLNKGIIWRLELRAAETDPRYAQHIDVPVYPAGE